MTDDLARAEIRQIAETIYDAEVCDMKVALELAERVHTAASRVREERGFVVVPPHPTEAMQKAFIVGGWKPEFVGQADDLVPEFGTGQGDLRMVPEWKNHWIIMKYSQSYRAMLAASQQRTADNGV